MTNQATRNRAKLGVEMIDRIGYTRGVSAKYAVTLFLLSKSYNVIINSVRLVCDTLKSVGILADTALQTQSGFFYTPNAQKHPSQGGNPRVFLKGKTI